jgi:DNA-binding HxlR family transcriptional regulator
MPKKVWTGYGRFCPLARALDVVGDRWTLVIVQELMKRPSRYGDLSQRLPGIGTSLLSDRLRKLAAAGVVQRQPRPVGEGVAYALTERGDALADSLEALRRWGVSYLTDPTADGGNCRDFDVHYVKGIDALKDGEFVLVVDGIFTTLRFAEGHLEQCPGNSEAAALVVRTSSEFMERWAAGEVTWDDGVQSGLVDLHGRPDAWPHWLAATGYLLDYLPAEANC